MEQQVQVVITPSPWSYKELQLCLVTILRPSPLRVLGDLWEVQGLNPWAPITRTPHFTERVRCGLDRSEKLLDPQCLVIFTADIGVCMLGGPGLPAVKFHLLSWYFLMTLLVSAPRLLP